MIEAGKFYAGIGSRSTPEDVISIMTSTAKRLQESGMILRSGGADGADAAFESGVSENSMKEIYLPWKGFNNRYGEEYFCEYTDCHTDIASAVHPAWTNLRRGARSLHTRNVAQVLGMDCQTPSNFVMCWTPGGKMVGGTATAMKIAMSRGIPVFNLFFESICSTIEEFAATGEFREETWRMT